MVHLLHQQIQCADTVHPAAKSFLDNQLTGKRAGISIAYCFGSACQPTFWQAGRL